MVCTFVTGECVCNTCVGRETLRQNDLDAKRAVREAKANGSSNLVELMLYAAQAKAAYRAILKPEAFKKGQYRGSKL